MRQTINKRSISSRIKRYAAFLLLMLFIVSGIKASDLVEVLPLTNKIILLHFDDGSVTYPNTLSVDRLNTAALVVDSFTVSSTDDANFTGGINPISIARKTKGTEFVKDVPWNASKNSGDPTTKPWASEHWVYLELEYPLVRGNEYTLNTASLAANQSDWTFVYDEKDLRSEAVHVNTIGYAADAPKYGYVYQWMGDAGNLNLSDYDGNTFWIYNTSDMTTPVKTGTISKRKSETNAETGQLIETPNGNFVGAEVFDCEFTDITANGEYVLVVEEIGRSFPFKIGDDALWEAAYACGRALYYQRSGIRLAPPYTDNGYIRPVNQNTKVTSDDGTDFSGLLLYSDYPYTSWVQSDGGGNETDQQPIEDAAIGNPLDVAGWYHDAGDWDGYQTHQKIPILLMLTYEAAPERFADGDLNLPESGNGIPDILDEASWLIKFNYRLRKELMAKGYSDGGVGGARVCPDIFNSDDGSAQNNKPSWKDHRRYIVTQADAFMTYYYAGQAAQFAYILKQLGKDPHAFPVEMLDAVEFADMTKDVVDWEQEAREAYLWAIDPANQPASSKNYGAGVEYFKTYAAVNLFRLTGEQAFQDTAKVVLTKILSEDINDERKWSVYSYLLSSNFHTDKILQNQLFNYALNVANTNNVDASVKRAMRWGGIYTMPMLIGQGTTPWVFESIMAYELSGVEKYKNVVHTTADYFLGTNPEHTSWATHVGPRPAEAGFHLDSRYNNNWELYPGFVPYGPWRMTDMDPVTYTIDGRTIEGGKGTWNKDWHNFSVYPNMEEWPGHERFCDNIHAPLSSENTVHQNAVYVHLTYGYVNSRNNTNGSATNQIGTITLNETSITLDSVGHLDTLIATLDINDASFAQLKWESSDPRIAHVDATGYVTGVTSGSTTITCSTLDGSVSASCTVNCVWVETDVESIEIGVDTLRLVEGQSKVLDVQFTPTDATNKFIDWTYSTEGVVSVDENSVLWAESPGEVDVYAVSLNSSQKDTLHVIVAEATDFVIADFDLKVPKTLAVDNDSSQVYTPGATNDHQAANPLIGTANSSAKTVKYNRPDGTYKLIGFALPTDSLQDLSRYSQLQFKYYGKNVNGFYVQLNLTNDSKIEITTGGDGEDCWQLFAYDISSSDTVKTINIFPSPTAAGAFECYFDDIKLAGKPAVRYDNISLSTSYIEMMAGETVNLSADAEGNPITFISADPEIATVEQDGNITGYASGEVIIKAVPLYGDPAECLVKVEGGCPPAQVALEPLMLLDFEGYPLNWSQGYGAYSWNTNVWAKAANPSVDATNGSAEVLSWNKDGTSNTFGGVAVQFPLVNINAYPTLKMQVYTSEPIDGITIDIFNGSTKLGSPKLSGLGIPANTWTIVEFDVNKPEYQNLDFNKIQFLVGGGSDAVLTAYIDNVELVSPFVFISSVEMNITEQELLKEETVQLSLAIDPIDATDQCIYWSSSNEAVATVSDEGLVTAITSGNATITATTREGDHSAECQITVREAATDATLADLKVDDVTIANFDAGTLAYIIELPTGTTLVPTVTALQNDGNANVAINAASSLPGTTSVVVTAEDGTTELTYTVEFKLIVSVNVLGDKSLRVYPNPVRNKMTIESENIISQVSVYDIVGQAVMKLYDINSGKTELETQDLNTGTYLIEIVDDNNNITIMKFFKE